MHSLAFVNRKCFVPGHLLVMLLKPTRRIPDMQPDELADLFLTAQRVQRGMELFPLRFFVERCRLRRSRCRAKHSTCARSYPASSPKRLQEERPNLRRTEQSRQGT